MIIDTHAHLTDESLSADLDQVLAEASAADVTAILCVGTTVDSSTRAVELAERHHAIRAAVGVHPNYSAQAAPGDMERIAALTAHPRVAAIGETGLDRYWDDAPWETQVEFLHAHIELSRRFDKPLVIHTRDCAEETLQILRDAYRHNPFRAVMHSFTGPLEVAEGCLELGLFISFAGMLTYKNADDIRRIAAVIPADRVLVETDCPYLTPHPHRGKRPNKPSMVVHTLAVLAEVRGQTIHQAAAQTTSNAQSLFGPW
ncbi:MAG: TatD family hydrolase [Pirellulales bacterium]